MFQITFKLINIVQSKEALLRPTPPTGSFEPLKEYKKRKDLVVSIPEEVREEGVQWVGVWSPTLGVITSATLDPDHLVPPSRDTLV